MKTDHHKGKTRNHKTSTHTGRLLGGVDAGRLGAEPRYKPARAVQARGHEVHSGLLELIVAVIRAYELGSTV
jgi:hypothetical protein